MIQVDFKWKLLLTEKNKINMTEIGQLLAEILRTFAFQSFLAGVETVSYVDVNLGQICDTTLLKPLLLKFNTAI